MSNTRRNFLKSLGFIAGGLVAMKLPTGLQLLPESLVPTGEAITHQWVLAEATRILASNLDRYQYEHVNEESGLREGQLQYGIDVGWFDNQDKTDSQESYSQRVLAPAMHELASVINDQKLTTFFPLQMPGAIDCGGRIYHPQSGIDMRYLRVFSPLYGRTIERFDIRMA